MNVIPALRRQRLAQHQSQLHRVSKNRIEKEDQRMGREREVGREKPQLETSSTLSLHVGS